MCNTDVVPDNNSGEKQTKTILSSKHIYLCMTHSKTRAWRHIRREETESNRRYDSVQNLPWSAILKQAINEEQFTLQ
jgi:hypothetical protein